VADSQDTTLPHELPPDTWSDPAHSAPVVPSEWHFSSYGYLRAPLRIGVGQRPACPPGATTPTQVQIPSGVGNQPYAGQYCALPDQSRTTFHSPYLPDDQYLAWTFDRTWEKAWAELYLSYGTNHVTGTIGLMAYDFTDTSFIGGTANPAQAGIGQAWVTITPTVPINGLRMDWKVGAFSEKYGMARMADGGAYDTYMFGRTYQMGESLTAEYDLGDFTFKAEHGFGVHLETVAAGTVLDGAANAQANPNTNGNPIGASPGFTLLNHVHFGVDWKRSVQINLHYMYAWSQDDRVQGTLTTNGNPAGPTGSMGTSGAEARILGHGFGDLYLAYSHIAAINVTLVGPAYEVVHSSGGGGHNGANGIYENFFGASGNGNGNVDNFQVGYDLSLGALLHKLRVSNSMGPGGRDVGISLFALYSAVSGTDPTSLSPYTLTRTNGTQKLKYGTDIVFNPVPWFGIGVRGDYLAPDSHDPDQTFGVITPKLVFRTNFISHEFITLQYSHYWDGSHVLAQQSISSFGYANIGRSSNGLYPNDADVFGIKAVMSW
jgi:hypothetical protein